MLVLCYKHKTLDARKKLGKLLTGDKKEPAPAGVVFMTSKKLYDNQVAPWLTQYVRSKGQQITPGHGYAGRVHRGGAGPAHE